MSKKAENNFFVRWLFGLKLHSETDSNIRRIFSRISVLISLLVIFVSSTNHPIEPSALTKIVSLVLIAWAVAYFGWVIAAIPFRTNLSFIPNATRLFLDGLVSIFQTIVVFGFFYTLSGLNPPDWQTSDINWIDYYYFSAVTFSTLGFGDFSPCPNSRLFAALQALIGNLHLGIVVGATFFAAVEHQLKSEGGPQDPN